MKFNHHFSRIIMFMVAICTSITLFAMIRMKFPKPQSEIKMTHLVPTDRQSMEELGLCPLFIKKKATVDPEILHDITETMRMEKATENEINQKIAELTFPGREYHIFKEGEFKTKQVDVDVPCVVPLWKSGQLNRTLIQLKGLDQSNLEFELKFPDGLCAGHSLNNVHLMEEYADTGEIKFLKYLNDQNGAANFLLSYGVKSWLNADQVKKNIAQMALDIGRCSAVSTVLLFDSNLDKNADFEVLFDKNEFNTAQIEKKKIRKGLQQDYFAHCIIIGNEEMTQSHGHFFMFAIIKALNEVQYIVIDTFPYGVYHVQPGSYELSRLMFLIQNIEQGSSTIKLPNVRAIEWEKSKKELEQAGAVF